MDERNMVRKHILVEGRVQGVGFRYRARYLAQWLDLTGWVRNLDDGRVEMELQGSEEGIQKLFERIEKESFIRIDQKVSRSIPLKEERSFQVNGDAC